MFGARAAPRSGAAARRCWMLGARNRRDLGNVAQDGRTLHQSGIAGAPRRAGARPSTEGGARTESTQDRNPSLPNSGKSMTDQRDILLVAIPAERAQTKFSVS